MNNKLTKLKRCVSQVSFGSKKLGPVKTPPERKVGQKVGKKCRTNKIKSEQKKKIVKKS